MRALSYAVLHHERSMLNEVKKAYLILHYIPKLKKVSDLLKIVLDDHKAHLDSLEKEIKDQAALFVAHNAKYNETIKPLVHLQLTLRFLVSEYDAAVLIYYQTSFCEGGLCFPREVPILKPDLEKRHVLNKKIIRTNFDIQYLEHMLEDKMIAYKAIEAGINRKIESLNKEKKNTLAIYDLLNDCYNNIIFIQRDQDDPASLTIIEGIQNSPKFYADLARIYSTTDESYYGFILQIIFILQQPSLIGLKHFINRLNEIDSQIAADVMHHIFGADNRDIHNKEYYVLAAFALDPCYSLCSDEQKNKIFCSSFDCDLNSVFPYDEMERIIAYFAGSFKDLLLQKKLLFVFNEARNFGGGIEEKLNLFWELLEPKAVSIDAATKKENKKADLSPLPKNDGVAFFKRVSEGQARLMDLYSLRIP